MSAFLISLGSPQKPLLEFLQTSFTLNSNTPSLGCNGNAEKQAVITQK